MWTVGGISGVGFDPVDHIREPTFSSSQSLKVLALESVTKNLDKLSPNLKELPEALRLSVEAKAEKKYIIT